MFMFLTTIIISVFNQLKYTKQCIDFLFKNTDPIFEVIIINNGSTDGTKEYLESIKDKVIFINNSQNLGYAKANNQGAEIAKGKYLVFLNNDTIVQKNWLSEMIKLVESDKYIAIVGSKLVYPDGNVQSTGVVVSKGGFPYELYRKMDIDLPVVNKVREFQSVIGASMLVRKDVFLEVGKFDEKFINHFEDTDLCYRVRQAGFKVFYCPTSVVIHYGGATEGRWVHYRYNINYFYNKWTKHYQDDFKYLNQDGYKRVVLSPGKSIFLKKNPICLIWEGSFFEDNKVSIINNKLINLLIRTGDIDISLKYEQNFSFFDKIEQIDILNYLDKELEDIPEFIITNDISNNIPPYSKWIFRYNITPDNEEIIQDIKNHPIDEIWVYNSFTKNFLIKKGFNHNKIYIIPIGASINNLDIPFIKGDVSIFTNKKFKFLFIGTGFYLDGLDILLEVYKQTFTSKDDVCLIIKTRKNNVNTNKVIEKIFKNDCINDNPEIICINEDFTEEGMEKLFRGCDCYVHPFRYKVSGIVIMEALGFSLPVIIPSKGCCEDFCDEKITLLVNSKINENDWEIEIDKMDLSLKMRYAYENQETIKDIGKKAFEKILNSFTWKHSAYKIINRLKDLSYKIGVYWYGDPISLPESTKEYKVINCSKDSSFDNKNFNSRINIYEGSIKEIENVNLNLNFINIGWITEPVNKLTDNQVLKLRNFSEIWLIDEHQYRIFREHFKNLRIIPPFINYKFFNSDVLELDISEKKKFNLLTIIDENSNLEDWTFLLNGFLKSFDTSDDVSLVIQLNLQESIETIQQKFLSIIETLGYNPENIPDIIFLNEKFENFPSLYKSMNALIFPFYSKGLTHRILEGLKYKLTIIVKENLIAEFLKDYCFVIKDLNDFIKKNHLLKFQINV